MGPAAVAVALLAESGWLAAPRVGYLAASLAATAVAVIALVRWTPPGLRRPLALACVALLAGAAIGTRAQLRLEQYSRSPAEVARRQGIAQRARLRNAVDAELRLLRAAAGRAVAARRDPVQAVRDLERAIGDVDRRAAMVWRGDTLSSWAGTLHADARRLTDPSGVVATPFGLTLYAAATSGGVRGVAASLLFAAPPADRLIQGLANALPSDEVTEGFVFGPPGDSATSESLQYADGSRPLFVARPLVPSPAEVRYRLLERARVRVGIALLVALGALLVTVARRPAGWLAAGGGVLVILGCIATVPLSEFSTRTRLFDPSMYFFEPGRAFTANAGALALTAATLLLTALLVVRRVRSRLPRWLAVVLVVATAGVGPYFVRALARGITPPGAGVAGALWVIWTIPLCLAATTLLVVASWSGRVALGDRRGLPLASGPTLALIAAVVGPIAWRPPGEWPHWYGALWIIAVGALVLSRPSRRLLLSAATVAALAAITVVWGSTSRGRMELAERDVRGLAAPDAYGEALATRLAASLQGEPLPRTRQGLLEQYLTSDLGASDYPVALLSWEESRAVASFGSAPFVVSFDTVAAAAVAAQRSGQRAERTARVSAYGVRIVAVPMSGGAVTILVAPRTRLIGSDAYGRWYGMPPAEGSEPPYSVQVIPDAIGEARAVRWRREGSELHGDWRVSGLPGASRAHVHVDLRGLGSLVPRGGLLLLIDVAAVAVVWLLGALADGRAARWLRLRRRRLSSYRARLSVVLFLFFIVPAAVFALWTWRQLFDDTQASRRLLVTETMRAVTTDSLDERWLASEGSRLDTKLLLYSSGMLVGASDSLFADLAPMGTLLRPDVALRLTVSDEASATRPEVVSGATGMLGYRVLPGPGRQRVLAAPARVDDLLLDRRRRDLGVLVLFATALGAAAAFWLSAAAARQLARPIGALRTAALAVARGERDVPLPSDAASEFRPVFTAFRAMAEDLGASRAALEEAQRRTAAVLRTVASGVIAVDESARVILANPRAEHLLGAVPDPGDPLADLPAPAVAARVARFLSSSLESDGFDAEWRGRTLRGQLTCLERGGAVLTLDDVTELARAQRVLAWGEMARQVAHEIKNPLTPIRLGVQHLLRAFGRDNFEAVLEQNVSRILTEIDRLDEIARAFSRYGSAPAERAPAEPTDVEAIVRDVVALETLGEGHVAWSHVVRGRVPAALARGDELREVLLNLFENARLADAHTVRALVEVVDPGWVTIAVGDDGTGIGADVLPRIFEPHFSTRTSGSGLGLAITRRLVESWGGTVTIESEQGRGTTVRVTLRVA